MEQHLERALEQLNANQLSDLNLTNKNLTKAQIIRLAEALKVNQSLTHLVLDNNQLGAEGAKKLSAALKVNQTLTSLDLGFNQLGAVGAASISEALKVNQTLTSLYLGANHLGAAGASMLNEVLKVNQTLTLLDLYGNQLDAAWAQTFSAALNVNQTLTSLNLQGNELDEVSIQVIQDAVQTNKDRIKNIRNQTLLTLIILLRHADSQDSKLPYELWEIILQQLDFPSANKGYRTSHALASFLTQPSIFKELNERLQGQQSCRLVEMHGPKLGESRFSFLMSLKRKLTQDIAAQPDEQQPALKKAKYN